MPYSVPARIRKLARTALSNFVPKKAMNVVRADELTAKTLLSRGCVSSDVFAV